MIQECLESLNTMNANTSGWDPMLVVLVKRKLPFKTREEWEKSLGINEVPKYTQLIEFFERRYRTVENLELVGESMSELKNQSRRSESKMMMERQSSEKRCIACNNERHSLVICKVFLNMSRSNRNAYVKAKRLCRNCLSVNHFMAECTSSRRCFKCNKSHHTLLHREEVNEGQSQEPSYHQLYRSQSFRTTRSMNYQQKHRLRALLDQCSDEEAFIKKSAVCTLGLEQHEIPEFGVEGMDGIVTATINKATRFELVMNEGESIMVEVSIM